MVHNEFPVIQFMLEELHGYVDYVILTEGLFGCNNKRKVPHFHDTFRQRFNAELLQRMRYFLVNNDAVFRHNIRWFKLMGRYKTGCWGPTWQRCHLVNDLKSLGLFDADQDDILIHGDADEIPSRQTVMALKWCDVPTPVTLHLHFFYYNVRCQHPDFWNHTVACRVYDLQSVCRLCSLRYLPHANVRRHAIEAAGWHFSFLMSPQQIHDKLHLYDPGWAESIEKGKFKVPDLETIRRLIDSCREVWYDMTKGTKTVDALAFRPSQNLSMIPQWLLQTRCEHPQFFPSDMLQECPQRE